MIKWILIILILAPLYLNAHYFVSTKSDKVNLRVGPGTNYPIKWVYIKKHFPLKVIKKYGQWRQVQDLENTEGWMHQSTLSNQRYLVTTTLSNLHSEQNKSSRIIATIDPMVIIKLKKCENNWCKVQTNNLTGWIDQPCLWGAN